MRVIIEDADESFRPKKTLRIYLKSDQVFLKKGESVKKETNRI